MLPGTERPNALSILVGVAAAIAVLAALTIVLLSASGKALFGFTADARLPLNATEDISARIELDRPSYHQGDLVTYTFELTWRDGRVTPDIEAFERAVSFYPFDRRSSEFVESRTGGGLRSLAARFVLQAVSVEAPGTYQLDTLTVFYTHADDGHTEIRTLRANPPPVYLGEFYPADVRTIATRPPKSAIDDARALRGALLALLGIVLLALAVLLAWLRGRRRADAELTEAEMLWRRFDALRRDPGEPRAYLVACEAVFADALELATGIDAIAFWSGAGDVAAESHALLEEARDVFARGYRAEPPTSAVTDRAEQLIDRVLEPLVEADRLRREREPDFRQRLMQQPAVVGATAALALAGLLACVLATVPATWLSGEIRAYNDAVALLDGDAGPQAALDAFLVLADQADEPRVKAAALYNVGTLLGDFRLTHLSRDQYESFLNAIFLPDLTLARLMHDMESDAEFELLGILTDMTRRYVQAEEALRATVRLDPADADARRNLEIFAKIRRAIAQSLARLARQGEQGDGTEQMLSQTVIDLKLLMEAELPDDYAREDEGKDDREYFIMERF